MNVQIFIPCFIDQLYPNVAFNMVKVLRKAGCTVHYNASQTCCGQPAFNAGFHGEAKEVCIGSGRPCGACRQGHRSPTSRTDAGAGESPPYRRAGTVLTSDRGTPPT